jgi:DNA-binding NarL/FixJ family response regulator
VIRLLLVDDQASIRSGLRMRLGLETDLEVVGEAETADDAIAIAAATAPGVVVMDIVLPGLDGIAATAHLRAVQPACSVVILSLYDDPALRERAAAAGAAAFITKHEPDQVLLDAIRAAAGCKP